MPLDSKKLKSFYAAAQQAGYKKDYNTFVSRMSGNDNYENRKYIYDKVKDAGIDIEDTYEEFMQNMQVKHSSTPKQSQSALPSGDSGFPSPQQENHQQPQPSAPQAQSPYNDEIVARMNENAGSTLGSLGLPASPKVTSSALKSPRQQHIERDISQSVLKRPSMAQGHLTQDGRGNTDWQMMEAPASTDTGIAYTADEEGNPQAHIIGQEGSALRLATAEKEAKERREYYKSLDDRISDLDRRIEQGYQDTYGRDVNARRGSYYGITPTAQASRESILSSEAKDYMAAQNLMKTTKRMQEAAQRYKDNPDALIRFTKDTGISFWNSLTDFSTWDFGMQSADEAIRVRKLYDKFAAKGEAALTPSERDLLDAVTLNTAAQMTLGDKQGIGNTVGQTSAEMLPFMIEMLVNPASGVSKEASKATAKAIARYAAKRFLQGTMKKGAAKAMSAVGKYGSRFLYDLGAGAVMSATTSAPHVVADAERRRTGTLLTDENGNRLTDEDGNVGYQGDSAASAYAKAFGARTIENQSELFGDAFLEPLTSKFGKFILRGIESKAGGRYLGKILTSAQLAARRAANTSVGRSIAKFNKGAHYNGIINEYLEEVVGNFENAATVGDNNFKLTDDKGNISFHEDNSVFNFDDNFATFLAVAVPGIVQGAASHAQYQALSHIADRGISRSQDFGFRVFPSMEGWLDTMQKVDGIDFSDAAAAASQVKAIVQSDATTADQAYAITHYAQAAAMSQSLDLSQQMQEEEETSDLIEAIREERAKGSEIDNHADAHAASREADQAEASLDNIQGGADIKQQLDDILAAGEQGGTALNAMLNGLTPEQRTLAEAYIASQSRINGIEETLLSTIDQKVEDKRAELAPYLSPEGTFATIEIDGQQRHVKGFSEDLSTVYYFDEEGKVQSAPLPDGIPNTFSGWQEAEDYLSSYRSEMEEAAYANVNSQLENHPSTVTNLTAGAEYSVPVLRDGEAHMQRYQVISEDPATGSVTVMEMTYKPDAVTNQDGSKSAGWVIADGASPVTMAKEEAIRRQNEAHDAYDQRQAEQEAGANQQEEEGEGTAQPEQDAAQSEQDAASANEQTISPNEDRDASPSGVSGFPSPQQENQQQSQQSQSALSRIPLDEQGQPIYEQADPDTAWDAILEQTEGDADMAQAIAADMVSDKEAALKRAQSAKPRKGATVAEKIAAQKEHKAAIDRAQSDLDHWKQIAATQQRRQEAEAAREAAAEESARKAAEAAAAAESEAPEWHEDTPQAARARGYRRQGGHTYRRQEPVPSAKGKEVEVKFADNVKQKAHVTVIDASTLQPSHMNGKRNISFFIDEAQPKERDGQESTAAAEKIASSINPEEITSSVTAYTGAPTVNARGEVIQGNNRSAALKAMWQNHPEQAKAYKLYLIDHAADFGLRPEAIDFMASPVLVNMADVTDDRAITLGQYTASDTESGGTERIKAKATAQKMGADMTGFTSRLLRSEDEDETISQLIDSNAVETLKWMQRQGYITPTQYRSAFDRKGNLTAEAANDLKSILYETIFQGGSTQLREMFAELPAKAQKAILAIAYRDYYSPASERILPELQRSIIAYHELSHFAPFAKAKGMEELQNAIIMWQRQYQIDETTGESHLPSEKYSNFALQLAAMYKGQTQRLIQSTLSRMLDLIQGKQEQDLFSDSTSDNTPRTLAEAIREVLNIEYNGRKGSNVLGSDDAASPARRQGSPGSDKPDQQGTRSQQPADNTGRAGGIHKTQGNRGLQEERDGGVQEAHVGLSDKEADDLLSKMEANAAEMPQLELTPANWASQFGEDGTVGTPVGHVKMGANQIAKLFEKGRDEQFGMIKPTLENPQIVVEIPSESNDGNTERNSSLLFVKTFIGKDGEKIYYFKSVTVKKGGLEVSISSHYDRVKRIKDVLKKGKLLYRFDGGAQTEHHPADVSVTTSHENKQGLSSASKGTDISSESQENTKKSSADDGKKPVSSLAQDDRAAFIDGILNGHPFIGDEYLEDDLWKEISEWMDEHPAATEAEARAEAEKMIDEWNESERAFNEKHEREEEARHKEEEEELQFRTALYQAMSMFKGDKEAADAALSTFLDSLSPERLMEVAESCLHTVLTSKGKDIAEWQTTAMERTVHHLKRLGITVKKGRSGLKEGDRIATNKGVAYGSVRSIDAESKTVTVLFKDGSAETYPLSMVKGYVRQPQSAPSPLDRAASMEAERKGEQEPQSPSAQPSGVSDFSSPQSEQANSRKRRATKTERANRRREKTETKSAYDGPVHDETVQSHDWSQHKEGDIFEFEGADGETFRVRFKHVERDEDGYVNGVAVYHLDADGKPIGSESVPPLMFLEMFKPFSDKSSEGSTANPLDRAATMEAERKAKQKQDDLRRRSLREAPASVLPKAAQSILSKIAKSFGAEVRYLPTDADSNGLYDPETNTIYLVQDANEALSFVFGHELTHMVKSFSQESYDRLLAAAKQVLGSRFSTFASEKETLYRTHGYNYGRDYYEEEAAADTIGSMIDNGGMAKSILRRLTHPVLTRILDALDHVINLFRGEKAKRAARLRKEIEQAIAAAATPSKRQSDGQTRHAFSGEKGATAADRAESSAIRRENLSTAKTMLSEGKDAKAIKLATGWEMGKDGKWRYEIPDIKYHPNGDAEYKKLRNKQPWSKELDALADRLLDGEQLTEDEIKRFDELAEEENKFKADFLSREKNRLADWVENKELFDAYPDLKNVEIVFTDQLPKNTGGYYSEKENLLMVNTASDMDTESVIAHELQHAIQRIEGFATGGSIRSAMEYLSSGTPDSKFADISIKKQVAYELSQKNNLGLTREEVSSLIDNLENDSYPEDKLQQQIDGLCAKHGITEDQIEDIYDMDRVWHEAYRRIAGEVEARNVQTRRRMTEDERRDTLASETEDVPRHNQIVLRHSLRESDRALRDALIDHMRSFGMDVITDEKEGQRVLDMAKGQVRKMAFGEPYDYDAYPLGRVEPDLASKNVRIITANADHGFANYNEARDWAKHNIARIYGNEETGGKGNVRISNAAVDKFMSQSAVGKSDSKDIHMAVLRVLPDVLKTSIDVETHPDFLKAKDGKRNASNGINKDVLVHRCYGAVSIDGNPYRVKITLKENVNTRETPKAYSYEATKIELLAGQHGDVTMTSPRNSNSSISVAKLLENVGMSYNPDEKVLDASKKRSKTIREQRVFHGSGADFDRFDHSHMSEGQGAQAYGWGTYVTEVEGIAEGYADMTSRLVLSNGEGSEWMRKRIHDDIISHFNVENGISEIEVSAQGTLNGLDINMDTLPAWQHYFIQHPEDFDPLRSPKDPQSYNFENRKEENAFYECIIASIDAYAESRRSAYMENSVKVKNLYTVDIPDDTGENYLPYDKPLTHAQIETIHKGLARLMESPALPDSLKEKLLRANNGYPPVISIPEGSTGEQAYRYIADEIFDEHASKFLSSLGFTGIKYPANYRSGGNKEGKSNYVIFNEADAKITDRVRFFRTPEGEAYGYTIGGKIYIDPRIATSETPIHEYTHLWATALRKQDPAAWQGIVSAMRGTSLWDEVRASYPELETDDDIADEVLAHYSGKRGSARLTAEMSKLKGENRSDPFAKAAAMQAISRVRNALRTFWEKIASLLHLPMDRTSDADTIADTVLSDLLSRVDPRSVIEADAINTDSRTRFHKVTDQAELDRLNSEPTQKAYRAMQVIDGKLYPPMAAKVNGKMVESNELGEWIRADENKDLAIADIDKKTGKQKLDKNGEPMWKFKLVKGSKTATGKAGTTVPAAYNPYWHMSRSPLNDQFKSAWIRPNIVIVECEFPASELTSGYKAERAKDAVGEVDWKSGVVSGEVYQQTGRARKVILSRWCKPVRVLSSEEVAEKAKDFIGDAKVVIPENVITPQQRIAFEAAGLTIGEPETGMKKTEQVQEAIKAGLTVDNTLRHSLRDDSHDSLNNVNDRFNEQIAALTEENADSVILSLGRPSAVLQSAGVKDKPMKLYGNKVLKKMRKHGFTLEDLRDLPKAVANPITVFNNYQREGNRSILTELETKDGNFLVTLELGKDGDIDFNIVSSVFGKGFNKILDWYNKGYATYIDKEKALSFLFHQSAPIAATAANEELSSAAKIVENFENPKASDENVAVDDGLLFRDDDVSSPSASPSGSEGFSSPQQSDIHADPIARARSMVEESRKRKIESAPDVFHLCTQTDPSAPSERRYSLRGQRMQNPAAAQVSASYDAACASRLFKIDEAWHDYLASVRHAINEIEKACSSKCFPLS